MTDLDDPQSCTKCGVKPEDILMLACGHDLCLNCAADRLAFEMKKNKNTNVIVCQECHQKTPLDAESVGVLKSLARPLAMASQGRNYQQPPLATVSKYPQIDTQSKYDRGSKYQLPQPEKSQQKYSYDKGNNNYEKGGYDRNNSNSNTNSNVNISKSKIGVDAFQGISSKKTCTEHQDEQILYFCFECKCECICPECVIHGKHKDHDVKTIRKSQPLIKTQVDKYLERFEHNVNTLMIKKNQIDKQIKSLTEQNNMSKRQIQQAFEDLRAKISFQQKQVLLRCDQNLAEALGDLQKIPKQIVKKNQQMQSFSSAIKQSARKDDILFLNFYSRKHKQWQQACKQPQIQSPQVQIPSNESVLSGVLDISDQVDRIGFSTSNGKR